MSHGPVRAEAAIEATVRLVASHHHFVNALGGRARSHFDDFPIGPDGPVVAAYEHIELGEDPTSRPEGGVEAAIGVVATHGKATRGTTEHDDFAVAFKLEARDAAAAERHCTNCAAA